MAVAYPTNLVIPLISGFINQDGVHGSMNVTETGPPRFELKTSNAPVFYKVRWFFNSIDFQVFEGWFKHTLKLGSESFNMLIKTPFAVTTQELRFVNKYSSSLIGKEWRVTAQLVIATRPISTVFRDFINSLNPTAYYRLGEESGAALAVNEVAGGKDLTYFNSPTLGVSSLVPSQVDTAATFDGATEFARGSTSDPDTVIIGDLTIVAFARFSSFHDGQIVCKGLAGFATPLDNTNYAMRLTADGKIIYSHENETHNGESVGLDEVLVVDTDYMFILTRDVTTKIISLDVNGAFSDAGSFSNLPTGGSTGNVRIGISPSNANNFNGTIDDVVLFNRKLTALEKTAAFAAAGVT